MNTVAITGASSMLGQCLRPILEDRGVSVVTVGRCEKSDIHVDFQEGIVTKTDRQADVVFHCAASFEDDSPEGVAQNYAVNATGTLAILKLAGQLGSDVIINAGTLSSDPEFDPRGFNSYGLSKAHGEELMAWKMKRSGGRFCSPRFPQLYDTAGKCIHHQPWFGRAIAYAAQGEDVNLPASEGPRSFLHIKDAAHVLIKAAQGEVEGVLNVVHPELVTVQEICEFSYRVFGRGGAVNIVEHKPPFRKLNYPVGSSAFAQLDCEPKITLEAGIALIRESGTAAAFGPLDVI